MRRVMKFNIFFIGKWYLSLCWCGYRWVNVARENARFKQTIHSCFVKWFPGNISSTFDMLFPIGWAHSWCHTYHTIIICCVYHTNICNDIILKIATRWFHYPFMQTSCVCMVYTCKTHAVVMPDTPKGGITDWAGHGVISKGQVKTCSQTFAS